jgi:transcriptional regulator with XRE-family HTH domain
MKTKNEEFEVRVPSIDGKSVAEKVKVLIPLRWDEEVKEWLLTPEAHQIIEDTKARHMGLLLPCQLKELRERHDCTQTEMGELFQVGEKSWTRWESGKHRPSRSINLIIRALYEGEISINYLLKQAGKPLHEVELVAAEIPHWFATSQAGITMNYGIVAGNRRMHFHATGKGKSEFLKMFLQAGHKSTQPWSGLSTSKNLRALGLDCSSQRFDYQNAKIA